MKNHIDAEFIAKELRFMVSEPTALKLADRIPAGICPECGGELIHRGAIEGLLVLECLRDRVAFTPGATLRRLTEAPTTGATREDPPEPADKKSPVKRDRQPAAV